MHKVIVHVYHSINIGTLQYNTNTFTKTNYFFQRHVLPCYISTMISTQLSTWILAPTSHNRGSERLPPLNQQLVPQARIMVCIFFHRLHCYRKKQRAAISFQKVSCLRQTKQKAVNSCQLPLPLLQLVRKSIWFPVKLQRKTNQVWDSEPRQAKVFHLTKRQ